MREAEERVLDLLLQNRALHQYLQRDTHPAVYEMKAAGILDSNFYSAELLSSSFMARHVSTYLNEERQKQGLPAVVYRVAAIKPRNPINTASEDDARLIEFFNSHRDQTTFRKTVTTDTGTYLQVSLPFLETGAACLRCHGNPDDAPQQLVDKYGRQAGFWVDSGGIRAIETIVAPVKSDMFQARMFFLALLVAFLSMTGLMLVVRILRKKVRSRTAQLAASEQKYRTLVEDLPCFVCAFLPDGTITYANRLLADYFKTRPENLIGSNMAVLVRPDEWSVAVSRFTELTPESPIGSLELQLEVRDGSVQWQHWIFRAIFDADKNVTVYQAYAEDVTERRLAEEAIKESEARFSTVFHASPIGICITRLDDGEIVDVNEAFLRLFGYRRDEVLGRSPLNMGMYFHPRDRERLVAIVEEQGRVCNIEVKCCHKSGSSSDLLVGAETILLGGVRHLVASLQDISERKLAEQALRESEQRQRALLNAIPDSMSLLDITGRVLDFRGASDDLDMPGYQLIGRCLDDAPMPPDVRNAIKRAINTAVQTGEAQQIEHDVHTPLGLKAIEARFVKCSESTVLSLVRNVTNRKVAEEALRISEDRYRSYVNNAPNAVMVVDRNGRLIEANPAAERMTGYSRAELLEMSVAHLLDPDSNGAVLAAFPDLDSGIEKRGEVAVRRKDSTEVWWSVGGVRLTENRYLCYCVDVTETRRLRAFESRAQRLESAGRVAGQVAHDFNNLLAPLTAYPDMIREDLPKDHPALAYLNSIEEAAQRIAEINQQLLTLGRRGHYVQEPVNLNEVVHHVLKQMDTPPATLIVDTNLADDLMPMLGGRSQIHRVLINLVQNAREAMDDVGRLSIRSENFYVDELATVYARVPRGEYVKLTLSDTGCGMSPEIIEKVFDPFFTTKKADCKRGSGLGLSVVDTVVHDHHGYIDLKSRVGKGTFIYLYFPITREVRTEQSVDAAAGGNELILVVDDDAMQCEVCLQILKRCGYRVEGATGGEEALEMMQTRSFDLLILDMIMPPGCDGAETYRRALEINSHQRAIILSGFAESSRVIEVQQMGAGAFLRKPITRNALARAVRRELDRQPASLVQI